ncbi:hypothetical protein FLL45_01980 [Aliikangiella marina]|uniref:Uncharacterized protein n=1 Tax=Aliikangiella marina TaxID=1712262 RepID=A0A545THP2_9GAMM|nr:hypothetical protein [Aliikangiella marina]TQV76750.1 hypothetical protein FLL45_01980 [Aliikangiella marina]
MTINYSQPAHLDKPALAALQALEKELGTTLVAYEEPEIAELTDEQLKKIQSLEECLGSTVIAYKQ